MMHPLEVRRPHFEELAPMRACFERILDSDFPEFPQEAKATYLSAWDVSLLERRWQSARDLFLIARQGEQIIGLVWGTYPEGGVATIIWLLVDKTARSQGVGAKLLQAASENYRTMGAHKLKLTVPTERAKAFYLAQGMKEEGFHAQHWWKTDFWAMALDL